VPVTKNPLSKAPGKLPCFVTVLIFNSSTFRNSSLNEPTKQLHERISQMGVRMQKLEKAIAELQQTVSSQPHPLLVANSQKRLVGPVAVSHAGLGQCSLADAEQLVEEFGMMSIRNDGKRQFHGETATSEVRGLSAFFVVCLRSTLWIQVPS
jgi:hypothetical protein